LLRYLDVEGGDASKFRRGWVLISLGWEKISETGPFDSL